MRYLVEEKWLAIQEGSYVADKLKVFVKQEPHKLEKLKEGRLRLIQAVSLVDTMVDRIIFGKFVRGAISGTNVLRTPCVVGWTPLLGGWRYMASKFPFGAVSIDRRAWDWSVRGWLVDYWESFLLSMHPQAPQWWVKAAKVRVDSLFRRARFGFSDGVVVEQGEPGIMKSGCLLTILLNSVSQTYLHCVASIRCGLDPWESQPLCCGDDTVQDWFPEVEAYTSALGDLCHVREAERTHGFVEFVGFLFNQTGFTPAYWKKHLFALRHLDPTVMVEALRSYQILYYNQPSMLALIQRMMLCVAPSEVMSGAELRRIADG